MTARADSAIADVVVVTHNSSRYVRVAVEPLADDPKLHVIVVDNGSSDGTLELIRDLDVTVIAQENRGFAHGCNTGWRAGTASAVLFLNPDARISTDDIELLVAGLDDEQVGIIGPRIVDGDDEVLTFSQRRFPRVLSTFGQALFASKLLPRRAWVDEIVRDERLYAEPHDVEWLSGACLLVRRSLLDAVGGWDETYFLYSEDTQLCRASWNAAARVRFEPRAVAHHVGGDSAPRARLLETLARSRMTYARKNTKRSVAALHRIGIGLEAATHAVVCRGGMDQRYGHLRALRAVMAPNGATQRHVDHAPRAA